MARLRRSSTLRVFLRAGLVGLLVAAGCAAPARDPGEQALDEGNYAEAIQLLSVVVAEDPSDWRAHRDLGVAHLRTGDAETALARLAVAQRSAPDDPSTLFHIGAAFERLDRPAEAVSAYRAFLETAGNSEFTERVERRVRYFAREAAVRDARALAAREDSLDTSTAPGPRTLTVTHFGAVGTRDEIAPLAAALSEWLVADLAKVESADLVLVERMRLDALLRELGLAESGAVDSTTAPRVGRLLAVERVVSGALSGMADDRIRADLRVVATETGAVADGGDEEGPLDGFVALEKALVFELLDALGVVPTEYERAQIELAPTRDQRALLAYGRGLLYERQGLLAEARTSYATALEYDADFGLAAIAFAAAVADPGDLDALLDDARTALDDETGSVPADGNGEPPDMGSRLDGTGDLLDGDFWPGGSSRGTRANPFPVEIPEPPRDSGGDQ